MEAGWVRQFAQIGRAGLGEVDQDESVALGVWTKVFAKHGRRLSVYCWVSPLGEGDELVAAWEHVYILHRTDAWSVSLTIADGEMAAWTAKGVGL